jgi:hypothetical protein
VEEGNGYILINFPIIFLHRFASKHAFEPRR